MKVVIPVLNNPVLLDTQLHLIGKFLNLEHDVIVFNDAKNFEDYSNKHIPNVKKVLTRVCERYKVHEIHPDNSDQIYIKRFKTRRQKIYRDILDYTFRHPDKYLILDSDVLPVDAVTIDSPILSSSTLNAYESPTGNIWPGVMFLNTSYCESQPRILLSGEFNEDQDWVINKLQEVTIIPTDHSLYSGQWDSSDFKYRIRNRHKLISLMDIDKRNVHGKYKCEIYDGMFLHVKEGTNWNRETPPANDGFYYRLRECLCS